MTNNNTSELHDFHWLMDMLQTIDVGLVVLDRDYNVQVWNSFMENHSGCNPTDIKDLNLFDSFPEVPKDWLTNKAESVFMLKNRAFTTWEQRPYLFKFKNYRPITGTAEFMYQNVTLTPLISPNGEVTHVCLIIYDVTDIATNKIALQSANSELMHLGRTDNLTQLNNRGYWEECLIREYQRYQRFKHTSCVVMFDIDHFKKVNDTYGHPAGDEVIRVTAQLLRDNLRSSDTAGRYGGEEFGIILEETDSEGAMIFCERLRESIAAHTVIHDGKEITFTASFGICQLNEEINDYKQWLKSSDLALYQSKEKGRNQTNIHEF